MYCILYIVKHICTLGCTGYWTVLYSTWSKPWSRRSNLLSQVLLWSSFYSLAGGNHWNRSFYGTLFKHFKRTPTNFKEFDPRRWTAKNRLQLSAGWKKRKIQMELIMFEPRLIFKILEIRPLIWSRNRNLKWSSNRRVSCYLVTFWIYVRLRVKKILWFV